MPRSRCLVHTIIMKRSVGEKKKNRDIWDRKNEKKEQCINKRIIEYCQHYCKKNYPYVDPAAYLTPACSGSSCQSPRP
uniref:Uncharacterized protein n=1 Tax=Romanomermis culicivorax TaxID=13658 RepID=A0A915JV02_ROMCU